MSTTIRRDHTHAVIYTGAPYGDNEGGHIVSLHKSLATAEQHCDSYAGQQIVALDEHSNRHGGMPREYFGE